MTRDRIEVIQGLIDDEAFFEFSQHDLVETIQDLVNEVKTFDAENKYLKESLTRMYGHQKEILNVVVEIRKQLESINKDKLNVDTN